MYDAVPTLEEQVHRAEVADGGVSLLEQSNRACNRFLAYNNPAPISSSGPKYSRQGWLIKTPAMLRAEAEAAEKRALLKAQYASPRGGGKGRQRPRSAPAKVCMLKRRPAPSTAATQRMLQLVTAETNAKTGEKLCINEELREVRGGMGRVRQKLFAIQEKKLFDGFLAYTDADRGLARRVAYCVDAAGAALFHDERDLAKPGGVTGGAISAHAGGRFAHAPPVTKRPHRAECEGTKGLNSYATLIRRSANFVLLLTAASCAELSELLPGDPSPLLLRQCEAAVEQSAKDGSKLVTLLFEGPGELCGSAGVGEIEPSAQAGPLVEEWERRGRPVAAPDDELRHLESDEEDVAADEVADVSEAHGAPGVQSECSSWKERPPAATRRVKNSELRDIVSRMPTFRSSTCAKRSIRDTLEEILLAEGNVVLPLTVGDCGVGARGGRGGVRRLGALGAIVTELLCDDKKVSMATKALPRRVREPKADDDPMPVLRRSTELFRVVERGGRMRDMRLMGLRQAGDRIMARLPALAIARRYGPMLEGLQEAGELFRGLNTRPIVGRYGTPFERLRKREDAARKRSVRDPERKVQELATADGQRLLRLARLACELGHHEEAALLTMDARRCFRWVGWSDREAGVTELRRIVQTKVVKARRAAGITATLGDDEFG